MFLQPIAFYRLLEELMEVIGFLNGNGDARPIIFRYSKFMIMMVKRVKASATKPFCYQSVLEKSVLEK